MGAIFGGTQKVTAKATPVTPRLSDAEMAARDEAAKTRKRMGLEDQVLSRLGKTTATGGQQQQQTSNLLGLAA